MLCLCLFGSLQSLYIHICVWSQNIFHQFPKVTIAAAISSHHFKGVTLQFETESNGQINCVSQSKFSNIGLLNFVLETRRRHLMTKSVKICEKRWGEVIWSMPKIKRVFSGRSSPTFSNEMVESIWYTMKRALPLPLHWAFSRRLVSIYKHRCSKLLDCRAPPPLFDSTKCVS